MYYPYLLEMYSLYLYTMNVEASIIIVTFLRSSDLFQHHYPFWEIDGFLIMSLKMLRFNVQVSRTLIRKEKKTKVLAMG